MTRVRKINWKYLLDEGVSLQTSIFPEEDIVTEFIKLYMSGMMYLAPRYAWDGASGPTADTENTIIPSAGHDAEFQLFRLGLLDRDRWWKNSNEDIQRWMIERGMWKIRAGVWKIGLDKFGYKHTLPKEPNIIEVF